MEFEYPAMYFVRHAESLHNERATLVRKKYGLSEKDDIQKYEDYKEVKFSPDYFDCGITEGGYKECQRSKKACENLDIGLVLVSPLKRAIITCFQTFKNHKNKPQVIVQPLLGERMTSACDLGTRLRESMQQFPQYNYDLFTQRRIEDTWYIENLPANRREEIFTVIRERDVQGTENIGKVVLEFLKAKGHLESVKEVAGRVDRLKEKLVNYMMKTNKKIAIVGHSNMIKTLTATGYKEDGTPINGINMENCEVQLINVTMEGIVKMDAPKTVWCG